MSSGLPFALRENRILLNLCESFIRRFLHVGTSNAILGKLGEQARGATWSHIIFITKLRKETVKNASELQSREILTKSIVL
jgi:hypothetical protein